MSSMMDNSEETSKWTFPKEKPQKKNFELWRTALLHVTLSIQTSLGPYIQHPHKNSGWYMSSDNLYLYKQNSNGTFDSFRQSPSARTTRRRKYIPCLTSYSPPLDRKTSKYASDQYKKECLTSLSPSLLVASYLMTIQDNPSPTFLDPGQTLTYGKN